MFGAGNNPGVNGDHGAGPYEFANKLETRPDRIAMGPDRGPGSSRHTIKIIVNDLEDNKRYVSFISDQLIRSTFPAL